MPNRYKVKNTMNTIMLVILIINLMTFSSVKLNKKNKFSKFKSSRLIPLEKICPETPARPVVDPVPQEVIVTLKGELRNATYNNAIPKAELEGLNFEFRNKDGSVIPSNVDGSQYYVKNLKEGVYKLVIKPKNFADYIDDVSIVKNESSQEKHLLLSPKSKGALRVVLTWNNKVQDLDLHATTDKN